MTTATLETTAFRTTEEILTLLRGFYDCTLPRADWTHAAHLTIALWHLLQYDWPEAVARVRHGIKRYNAAHGIVTTPTGGYHDASAPSSKADATKAVRSSPSPTS